MHKITLQKITSLICLTFIPFLTVGLANKADWVLHNFTYLSGNVSTGMFFRFWAFLIIVFCILSMYLIKEKYQLYKPNILQLGILLTLLTITAFIPYENHTSIVSLLHVLLAYLSIIYLNYLLFTIYNFLKLQKYPFLNHLATLYILMFSFCFFLSMIFGSISSLVETIYTVSVSLIFGFLLK